MAYEAIQTRLSFPAGAAITQFTFVKLNSSAQVIPCAATTDDPIGVAQDAPASGDTCTVCVAGVTKIVTGAAASSGLAVGTIIGTDASAAALALTAGTDTTKYIAGKVIEASAAAAELVSALINCAANARAA